MINVFRIIHRKYFCPRAKRLLLELFDSEPNASVGIIFEEVTPLSGETTIHQWWKVGDFAFCRRINKRSEIDVGPMNNMVKRNAEDFDNLLELIEKADKPPVKNFSSGIRDGLYYFITWGTKGSSRAVGIHYSTTESHHARFVQLFKDNTWK